MSVSELMVMRIIAGLFVLYLVVRGITTFVRWFKRIDENARFLIVFIGTPIVGFGISGSGHYYQHEYCYKDLSCEGVVTGINRNWDGERWTGEVFLEVYQDGIKITNNPWHFIVRDQGVAEELKTLREGEKVSVAYRDWTYGKRQSEALSISRAAEE